VEWDVGILTIGVYSKSSKESVGTVGIIIPGHYLLDHDVALGSRLVGHTPSPSLPCHVFGDMGGDILCRPIIDGDRINDMTAYILTPEIPTG